MYPMDSSTSWDSIFTRHTHRTHPQLSILDLGDADHLPAMMQRQEVSIPRSNMISAKHIELQTGKTGFNQIFWSSDVFFSSHFVWQDAAMSSVDVEEEVEIGKSDRVGRQAPGGAKCIGENASRTGKKPRKHHGFSPWILGNHAKTMDLFHFFHPFWRGFGKGSGQRNHPEAGDLQLICGILQMDIGQDRQLVFSDCTLHIYQYGMNGTSSFIIIYHTYLSLY